MFLALSKGLQLPMQNEQELEEKKNGANSKSSSSILQLEEDDFLLVSFLLWRVEPAQCHGKYCAHKELGIT